MERIAKDILSAKRGKKGCTISRMRMTINGITRSHIHLKKRFGRRVFKASIDAGFTCPNLDGTRGTGRLYLLPGWKRCICTRAVALRFRSGTAGAGRIHSKWKDAPVIAYFQAHTNTYAPLDTLKRKYEEALSVDGVCGLSIATRADALPKETVAYLAQLSQQTYLTVELGLQTIHDGTAERIHRGHSYAEFLHAYQILKGHGIRVCVHLIDGLPGETQSMMLETARAVGRLRPDARKAASLAHPARNASCRGIHRRETGAHDAGSLHLHGLFPAGAFATGDGDRARDRGRAARNAAGALVEPG